MGLVFARLFEADAGRDLSAEKGRGPCRSGLYGVPEIIQSAPKKVSVVFPDEKSCATEPNTMVLPRLGGVCPHADHDRTNMTEVSVPKLTIRLSRRHSRESEYRAMMVMLEGRRWFSLLTYWGLCGLLQPSRNSPPGCWG